MPGQRIRGRLAEAARASRRRSPAGDEAFGLSSAAQCFPLLRTGAQAAPAMPVAERPPSAVFHCESRHIRVRVRHELDATTAEPCFAMAYQSVG